MAQRAERSKMRWKMTGHGGERATWPMLFLWFDHPLIEVWLEPQIAASRRITSHDDAASAPPEPPRDARQEPSMIPRQLLHSRSTTTCDRSEGPDSLNTGARPVRWVRLVPVLPDLRSSRADALRASGAGAPG